MNIFDELDRSAPLIPETLLPANFRPHQGFGIEVADLWEEVLEEVCDAEYARRSHHNVGTYDQGCRGPLCRKARREHPRRKNGHGLPVNNPRYERLFDPILEYFHTVAKYRVRDYKRKILEGLTA
jgi:hypothetical protein